MFVYRCRLLRLPEVWRKCSSQYYTEFRCKCCVSIASITFSNSIMAKHLNFVFYFHSLAQSVRLMMALAIFLSYGLQFYVPINIMGPWFRDLFTGDLAQRISDVGLRVGLVIFTCKLFQLFTIIVRQTVLETCHPVSD